MELRPYQRDAVDHIFTEWEKQERKKTLLVLATGLGKTICFCKVAEKCVSRGERVLILAHRGELLEQASDKLQKVTGLKTSLEKADSSCFGSPEMITVGSVQTMQREKRLAKFSPNYFQTIIVDEAHHSLSDGYQRVLDHFPEAKILGVTATPDRGDKKNLGQFYESIAFEYSIAQGIRDGYLSKIRALTIPLNIDLTEVKQTAGDFSAKDLGSALDPYLDQIADQMQKHCKNRKTIVFLPLIATSQKFKEILNRKGFRAEEINGSDPPEERKRKLDFFEADKINVLCNSMLLTEGFDCPSIDCVICLRPTKVRSLYTQIIGRGTRLAPKKDHCLILDFLWHTEKHELCHPAHLVTDDPKKQKKMTEIMEEAADDGQVFDVQELEVQADREIVKEREESLAKQLAEMKTRKSKFVDPLQWELSINSSDLDEYEPSMGWEMAPMSDGQKRTLEKYGINPDGVETAGKASLIINKLIKRKISGLTTPKQIRLLEKYGFHHVGEWEFSDASQLINQIAGAGWKVPKYIGNPATYDPKKNRKEQHWSW